jgi:hypothetical protein
MPVGTWNRGWKTHSLNFPKHLQPTFAVAFLCVGTAAVGVGAVLRMIEI